MKKMWIVLAGNVPVCIKKGEIFPITAFMNQRKNIFIPIFDDFHKARIFAYRITVSYTHLTLPTIYSV